MGGWLQSMCDVLVPLGMYSQVEKANQVETDDDCEKEKGGNE